MQNKMTAPHFKKNGLITVCNYKNFIPVIYDQGKGYEAALLKAIAALWKVRIKFISEENYEGIWYKPSENHSPFDIAAAGIDPNSRPVEKRVTYSIPTAHYQQSLLVLTKEYVAKKIISYESFKDKENLFIGVLGNTTGETYALKRAKEFGISKNIIKRYENEEELLHALIEKEIQAIARGTIGNEYQEMKNNEFKTIEKYNFDEMLAYSVDPDNEELLIELNKAILLLTNHNKISYSQWFQDNDIFIKRVQKL